MTVLVDGPMYWHSPPHPVAPSFRRRHPPPPSLHRRQPPSRHLPKPTSADKNPKPVSASASPSYTIALPILCLRGMIPRAVADQSRGHTGKCTPGKTGELGNTTIRQNAMIMIAIMLMSAPICINELSPWYKMLQDKR